MPLRVQNIGDALIRWWKARPERMRLIIFSFILIAATCSTCPIRTPDVQHAKPSIAVARLFTEVRLRKLHLARPDLIPYPFAYEVYC